MRLQDCPLCNKSVEHEHSMGTLSPEQAIAHWKERAENAPKSWD